MLLCAGVVVVVMGVLCVTVPRLVVGGVGGGVDIAVGVGGVGVADGEGVTVVAGVYRGGVVAWVLLVLVLGLSMLRVGGGVAVLALPVVPVLVLVGAPPGEL